MTTTLTPEALEYLANLAPTTCLVCGRDLTDAVSVDRGIGPECSKKHYTVDFILSEEMVQVALGHIAFLELDGTLPVTLVEALVANKQAPRNFANLLIKWAATQQADSKVILALVPAIRAIGFGVLADRLLVDRSTCQIIHDAGRIWVRAPWDSSLDSLFRRIGGKPGRGPKGRGNRSGHWLDAVKYDAALCVLGICCPNIQAVEIDRGSQTGFTVAPKTRDDLRALIAPKPSTAPVGPSTAHQIVHRKGYIEVFTPYSTTFVADLKGVGTSTQDRRWNPTYKCWEVDNRFEAQVLNLIRQHYGVEPTVN